MVFLVEGQLGTEAVRCSPSLVPKARDLDMKNMYPVQSGIKANNHYNKVLLKKIKFTGRSLI